MKAGMVVSLLTSSMPTDKSSRIQPPANNRMQRRQRSEFLKNPSVPHAAPLLPRPLGRPSPLPDSQPHFPAKSPLAKFSKIVYLLCIYLQRGMSMKTRIQKWGNSLALRIPKSFALETGLDQDAMVDVALVDGKLIVTPLQTPSITLEQLLAGIT